MKSQVSTATIKKGILLFLLACVPLRLLLAYVAKVMPLKWLPFLGGVFLVFGLSAWYLYLSQSRMTGTGAFGGVIWWTDMRPIHGTLYITFAILAFLQVPKAYVVLLLDVLVGLVAFYNYHSLTGNFKKIMFS